MHEGDFLVERYRVVRKLGNGAMGQVWLAYDELLNRHVAIKHLLTGSQESLNDELVQRAMREARLAAQLNHPNAVQIFDLITSTGEPHVVMEYVEGETLANRLERGRLAPYEIRPVIRQVAAALAAAHELGIVHRDVKPANILIAANGVAKLADFGIARASHDANLTVTGLVIGTLAYMAPEVGAGDPATPASDVWSLGATAYAATEGRAPFAGESSARMLYRKVSEPPPLPTGAGELSDVMRAMMATEASQRPVARDVARALEGSGPPSWAGAAPPPGHAEPTTVRRPVPDFDATVYHHSVVQRPPASAPVAAGTAAPGLDPRTLPHATQSRRRRGGLLVAAIAIVCAIAAGAVALVLTSGSGDNAAGGTTRSLGPSSPAPVTVTVSNAPPSTTSAPAPSTTSTTSTPAPTVATSGARRYVGPNGLSAEGPSSWDNSCAGADGPYYWCAGPQGFLGGYFRLRLKTAHTSSFAADVQSEVDYFRTKYSDGVVHQNAVTGWPIAGDAVDLTYAFTNSQGIPRKGIERVFAVNGSTYIIATTDVRANFDQTQQVFQQLVASAEI